MYPKGPVRNRRCPPRSMLYGMCLRLAVLVGMCAAYLCAGEYVVLTSGFRLEAEGHERVGDRVRLFQKDGNFIELPSSVIVRFEKRDEKPERPATKGSARQDVAASPEDIRKLIDSVAERHRLPAPLVHSVIEAESAYDPEAVSPKGAVGLMQLMPETASDLAVEDRTDPAQNVSGGTRYLKGLLERYSESPDQLLRALAAYNAGPEKVDHYDGLPPYNETRLFVRRVMQRFLALSEPTSEQ